MEHQTIVVGEHIALVRAVARSFRCPKHLRDERLSEAMLALVECAPKWKPTGCPKAYIEGCVRNHLSNWLRSERRRSKRHRAFEIDDEGEQEDFPAPTPDEPTTEAQDAIPHLPADLAEILTLRLRGLTREQIAEETTLTFEQVRIRCRRIAAIIRQRREQ